MIIGLTGGIGSGKSAASEVFISLGVPLVDADIVAREVVEPGEPALAAIAEHFGQQVIDSSGALDRAALRSIVFDAPEQRQWLEQLLHPLIRQRIIDQLAAATKPHGYAILASPLLLETDQHKLVDQVVVVDIPEQQQLARTAKRDGNSEQQVAKIMAAQLSREQRLQRADHLLDNSASLEHLAEQVSSLHRKLATCP